MKPLLLTLLGLALLGFVGWLWKHKRKMLGKPHMTASASETTVEFS